MAAPVGDEQKREDPTVNALEEAAAAFVGQPEAVYLPSATMANEIALVILGVRGSELIVEESAHIMISELGGAAAHAGLQTRGLPGNLGRLTPEQVRGAVHARDPLHAPSASILALEDTHNSSGGTVWPQAELEASSPPDGSWDSRCTLTARASRTPRSRAAAPPRRSAGSSTP